MKRTLFKLCLTTMLAMVMGPYQLPLSAHDSHHHHDDVSFLHTFDLSTMDSTFLINGTPTISIVSTVKEIDCHGKEKICLTIPSFTFTIPESSLTPLDGYVYTIPSTNLPDSVWHSQGLPYSIPSGSNTTLYVFNDGAIVIGGPNFLPLLAGTYTVNQTTISYELDKTLNVPKNFKISDTTATVAQYNSANDLLDFYNNDYYDNVFAYTWSANPPGEVTNSINVNFYAAVGKIVNGKPKICTSKALFIPNDQPLPQRCLENTISINPKNKKNLVAISSYGNDNFPVGGPTFNRRTFLRSYTFDGGCTWQTDQMTGDNRTAGLNLPQFRSDPNSLCDEFGNFWIVYMTAGTPDLQPPFELCFAASSDGGINYTVVGTTALNAFLDYPRITFGGDGQGGKALWFSVDYVDSTTLYVSDVVVGYVPVTGLGQYGTLTYDLATGLGKDVATNSICYIQVPEITATPNGDVYLYAPTQIVEGDNGNYTQIVVAKHTGGIQNFNSFKTPEVVLFSNVGLNNFATAALGKAVPFQPTRGVFGNATRGIDYDPLLKRLWIGGVNIKPNNFSPTLDISNPYNMSIFSMYSDDNGKTWSSQSLISNTQIGPRALPSIKVNRKKGGVAYFWYDARNDASGVSVQPFGAITK